jgi:hypothetical protein
LRDAREQAFLEFRLGRQNVFDAPRRVECVHAEKLKRAANKGNDFCAFANHDMDVKRRNK